MVVATIEVRPLSEAGGAEIRGVDLSRPVDGAAKAAIIEAWRRYSMLLFRDQALDDEASIRFCEIFGEVQPERQTPSAADDHRPGIHYVSNQRENGILPDGDIWWHSDQIFYDLPAAATTLYCVAAPKLAGGETRFANCQLAYDALDEAMKRRLEGLKAESFYLYNSANRLHREAPRQGNELCATHPVIRTHPETGAKAIFVNRLMTDFIHGMDRAESDALLEALYDLCEEPRFCWQHRWREGDQIIWDNRNLMHCRNTYDHVNDTRDLRRIAIKGDTPY
jgi:taurine dioxygenase